MTRGSRGKGIEARRHVVGNGRIQFGGDLRPDVGVLRGHQTLAGGVGKVRQGSLDLLLALLGPVGVVEGEAQGQVRGVFGSGLLVELDPLPA